MRKFCKKIKNLCINTLKSVNKRGMEEDMELSKQNKIKNFFKRYGVMIIAGVFVVAIALTVGLTLPASQQVSTTRLDFTAPMLNAEITKDFSDTDLQYNENLNRWEIHLGIDFAGEKNAVFSVLDGTVLSVTNNSLEGYVVEIEHADGFTSVYSSLGENVLVKEGDTVEGGQQIGEASNTATSEFTDSQLHFCLLKDGVEVDPNLYIDLQNK